MAGDAGGTAAPAAVYARGIVKSYGGRYVSFSLSLFFLVFSPQKLPRLRPHRMPAPVHSQPAVEAAAPPSWIFCNFWPVCLALRSITPLRCVLRRWGCCIRGRRQRSLGCILGWFLGLRERNSQALARLWRGFEAHCELHCSYKPMNRIYGAAPPRAGLYLGLDRASGRRTCGSKLLLRL